MNGSVVRSHCGKEFVSNGSRGAAAFARLLVVGLLAAAWCDSALAAPQALRIEDYATMPQTGVVGGGTNQGYMARVNFMRDDPTNAGRSFVNDLNGPMYILDKSTKSFTQYLNFNGVGASPGLFDRFYHNQGGFGAGFITFEFDPDYANNGKFYTSHMESGTSGSQVPTHPNLNTSNYGPTPSLDQPGNPSRQVVLVEWQDSNVANSTFEGSARELLRMDARDRIHPLGDIIFNPTAGPGDDDWRMMYLAVGDWGNGEQGAADVRRTPQLLNSIGGKILRIAPDANVNIPTNPSPNNKYWIPTDNPFTGIADVAATNGAVRDEIWALGFRNPHRMAWDVDPLDSNPETNNRLIVNDIGLFTWEEVNFVTKGSNYGYSDREGNQQLGNGARGNPPLNSTGPLPNPDLIPNHLICAGGTGGFANCTSNGTVTPTYPVIQYGHGLAGQDQVIAGDGISSGFVYRGTQIPQLYGKYLFGDITTGALYYADYDEMIAADDGDPSTLAEIHSLQLLWDDPNDPAGEVQYGTLTSDNAIRGPMFQIAHTAYIDRTGLPANSPLPQAANVTGSFGRSDIRIAQDANGELFILSKSDGMIRAVVGWVPEPTSGLLLVAGAMLLAITRRGFGLGS